MAYRRFAKKNGYRRKGRKTAGRAVVKRAVRKARTKIFNKRVLRAVSRTAETKVVNWRVPTVNVNPPTQGSFANTVYVISPSNATYGGIPAVAINQGTGQGERVGNKISPVSFMFKGVVRPYTAYDAAVNANPGPMYVVLWVVSLQKHLTDDLPTLESVIDNSFYQTGNTSTGITGQLIDLTQSVNTQHITVHKRKVMKIGYGNYISAFAVNSANNVAQQFNNNDFSLSRMFAMRLKMQKTLMFNDATANPVNMRRWWFFAVPYRVDGNVFANGSTPLVLDFSVDMKFKDL